MKNSKPKQPLFQKKELLVLAVVFLVAFAFLILMGSCDGCAGCTPGSSFGGLGNG